MNILKKMKLASKLAVILGGVLTVLFVFLILVISSLTRTALFSAIGGELNAISIDNATKIQQIFTAAETVATDMQSYLDQAYQLAETDPSQMMVPTSIEGAALCRSKLYNQVMPPLCYTAEQYLIETARSGARNNADIWGVGAMFEPYQYTNGIRDYAFYLDESTVDSSLKPYGSYESYAAEAFYSQAASSKQDVVTEPYEFDGKTLVSYASPIIHNGQLKGVVMADININNFSKVDATSERYPTMYATIYDGDGDIIYDSEDMINVGHNVSEFTPVASELAEMQAGFAAGEAFNIITTREDGRNVCRYFNPIQAAGATWWSLTAVDQKDMSSASDRTIYWMLGLATLTLMCLVFVTITVLRKVLQPLNQVVQAAEQISAGNLEVQLTVNSTDEIGMLSDSFQSMVNNLKRMVTDVGYLLGEMADGNFQVKTQAEDSYVGEFEAFLLSIRQLNNTLSDTLKQINQSADQVASGADQVASGAQALSQGATEQASSVEELAATIAEVSEQIRTNAANAQQASALATQTGDEMIHSNQQMQAMVAAMEEISRSSNEIGKIIKTIEDIAFQTNILALNAAVEAARAGAAGKGFAVVADEVRNLASKSAEASQSTSDLIEGSLRAVARGTEIVSSTASSLMEALHSARQVTDNINEISQASAQQSLSLDQINQGVDQISSVVQTNSATSEESAAASEELSGQAQMLKGMVSRFRLKE